MRILLAGVNHRTAPVELRERLAFNAEQARRAELQLRTAHGFREAVVVSTCNRSEIYGVVPVQSKLAEDTLECYLADFHGVCHGELHACVYRRCDADAVQHLFRVTAGLESMLLGEAEILGQVRDAYKVAVEAKATGPVLNRMFQAALEVGKRVRTETDLGTRPMSVAFAGVKLAQQIFGDLRHHRALIVGAGTMGEQVVEHLRNRGIERIYVANRSRERGGELAARFGGELVSWDQLGAVLAQPDIVVTSVSSSEPVVSRAMIEHAMHERKNRGMLLIDLGVPRNIDPAVEPLYNVYLYNIDNLNEIVEHNRKAREQEVPRAEAIVVEHVTKFEAWQSGMLMHTLLEELHAKLEREREAFLLEHRELIRRLSPEERRLFGALAEQVLERLVHEPAIALTHPKDLRPKPREIQAVREFFGLIGEKS